MSPIVYVVGNKSHDLDLCFLRSAFFPRPLIFVRADASLTRPNRQVISSARGGHRHSAREDGKGALLVLVSSSSKYILK